MCVLRGWCTSPDLKGLKTEINIVFFRVVFHKGCCCCYVMFGTIQKLTSYSSSFPLLDLETFRLHQSQKMLPRPIFIWPKNRIHSKDFSLSISSCLCRFFVLWLSWFSNSRSTKWVFAKFITLQPMMNGDEGGYSNCHNVWKLLHSMLQLIFSSGKSHKNASHWFIVVILDVCVREM